jgi:hypothetical protein
MQGAQKLRSEAHLQVRRSDEVEAQRRRWTFYETINLACPKSAKGVAQVIHRKSIIKARGLQEILWAGSNVLLTSPLLSPILGP